MGNEPHVPSVGQKTHRSAGRPKIGRINFRNRTPQDEDCIEMRDDRRDFVAGYPSPPISDGRNGNIVLAPDFRQTKRRTCQILGQASAWESPRIFPTVRRESGGFFQASSLFVVPGSYRFLLHVSRRPISTPPLQLLGLGRAWKH